MKFKDLEIGQRFKFLREGGDALCERTGPGTYTVSGKTSPAYYLGKRQRDVSVISEGEPPSAERAAREPFHLLQNMKPTAEEVRAWREAGNGGLQEGFRALQKAKVLDGLDALQETLQDSASLDRDAVLHDLIEIVKILANR